MSERRESERMKDRKRRELSSEFRSFATRHIFKCNQVMNPLLLIIKLHQRKLFFSPLCGRAKSLVSVVNCFCSRRKVFDDFVKSVWYTVLDENKVAYVRTIPNENSLTLANFAAFISSHFLLANIKTFYLLFFLSFFCSL